MEQLFLCPPDETIADIPSQDCPERFDQIIKFFFQKKQLAGDPPFTTSSILLAATWTPYIAASDETKIQGTPLFAAMTIPPSEILRTGGGTNETIGGVSKMGGRGNVLVPAQLQDVAAPVRTALRKYAALSSVNPGYTQLTGFFVNRFGDIICRKVGSNHFGIDIYGFYVGDPGTDGLGAPNISLMSFELLGGWADDVVMVRPTDFNPVELTN
jgi:hypothetical protein